MTRRKVWSVATLAAAIAVGGACGSGTKSAVPSTTTIAASDQAFCDRLGGTELGAIGVAATPVPMSLDKVNTPGVLAKGARYITECGWGSAADGQANVSLAVAEAIPPKTVADIRRDAEANKPAGVGPLMPIDDVGFLAYYGTADPQVRFIGAVFVGDRFVNVQGLIPGGAAAKQAQLEALLRRIAGG